jgi:hypothetical protein
MVSLKRVFPLLIIFSVLTLGWFVQPSQISSIPLCLFKFVFHVDCPGCGLTRSFLVLSRGHIMEAVRFNPAGPLIYLLFIAYFIEGVIRLGKPDFSLLLPPRLAKSYSLIVVLVLIAQWLVKLSVEWPNFSVGL